MGNDPAIYRPLDKRESVAVRRSNSGGKTEWPTDAGSVFQTFLSRLEFLAHWV